MQSFRESTAPPTPHLGFTSAIDGGRGASSYLAQPLGPQNSPRMPEEYVGVQQQQHNPHSMMSLQTNQAALLQGYGSRGRGGGSREALPCDAKHGGGNSTNSPYRKDMMDYYYSSTSKEGHRRGGQGLGYGTGLGFSNMDGQVPHQYRPARTSGSVSGMSRYQMDYGAVVGSGGNSNNSNGSGAGAFSPSHQYSLGQNPPVQTAVGPQMHLRHQAPNYPSHQTLHHAQLQRGYALPGHRFPPPFSHYPPNAPTGPVGVYNSLPQRYQSGRSGGSFESKSNSSSSATSSHNLGLANQNNTGPFDSAGQSYPISDYLYNSQSSNSHPVHPVHPHRHPQQSLGPGYDTLKTHSSNLVNQPGLPYPKHPSSSKSSSSSMNLSVPQFPSHDVSKSPMHSQTQQPQIHQNFSPISNPSPVASVVQSPSCSSSPSPLMGVLEGAGSSVVPPTHSQSHPPIQKSRNSHNRLLQMMHQLSPTPSSNSNSSSCGSSGNVSTAGLNANTGSSHSQTRVGVGTKGGVSDEHSSSSFYSSSSHDKLILDPGTNSLNALSSQVANLPDTVQHVMLSDSVLSDKRNKDTGHQTQKPMHAMPADQQGNSDVSAPCGAPIRMEPSKRPISGGSNSECGIDEDSQPLESPRDDGGDGEALSETPTEKMTTLSETKSTGSCPPPQNQMSRTELKSQNEGGSQISPLPDSSAPSSSSFSSHLSPSVEHSAFLSPTRPPSTSLSVSSTPSPTIISSAKSGVSYVQPKVMDCEQLSNKNEQGVNKGSKMAEEKQNSDICQGREKYGKEKGKTKQNEESHTEECTKEKEGEIEKLKDFERSNEPGVKQDSTETHNAGGVGVIVSTRSEITQQEEQSNAVMSEPTKPDFPNNPGSYSSYSKQQTPPQFSFTDSSNHNGESRGNLTTNPSPHGEKVSPKSSVEHWLASHAHSDTQKALLGYSKSPQNSGMKNSGRPLLSEVGMAPNLQFQDYCQPQRQYSPEVRKTLDIDDQGRKDLAFVTEKGRDGNAQLQQPFPSLLQEVLQGYHTDKNYGRSERIAQQFQAPITHNYSHYRHSQTTMEHTRPHVMTSQARMAMNHHIQTQTSAYEKLYPLKERHESEVCIGQDPPVSSWGTVGVGTKRAQWNTLDKCKVESPIHSTSTMPLSADLSTLPHSRHINLADYSLPSRKLSSNHSSPSSAVQQLLLQETDQIGHSGITVGQPQSTSLSERRSVICDISPSCLATPDRELDGVKGERSNCESQSECKGTSVIQQSVMFSATVDKGSTSNEQGIKREMEPVGKQQDIKKAHHFETSVKNDSSANENVFEHDNASHQPQDEKPSKDGRVNLERLTPYQPHHLRHSHSNTHSSPASSRFQSYFEGSEESKHSAVTGGFGFKDGRKETNKTLQHPHHNSPHHNFSSLSQAQNLQSTDKLQMYLQSNFSSLRSSHSSDGWTAPKNIQNSSKDITFPGSGQQQNHLAATQQQLPKISSHGSFCEKMWDQTSEKEKEGKTEEENIQSKQQPPTSVLPLAPPTETKQLESSPTRVESQNILKSLHGMSDKVDSSGKSINIMTHGKTRTGSSGDTNPLMMRRRVRSFISPIPAKRQHQDMSQQQQRGTPSQHSNIVLSSANRHVTSGLSSPNAAHYNLTNQKTHSVTPPRSDSPKSPSSFVKTKILPPRKSRGLKLEAIVQKITPTLKKTANTNSNVNLDSVSNHLSLTEIASYGPDTHNHDSTDGGVFIRSGAESENCPPYLSEGLSLDDIISYRGVEQTGPPPPTAYPCDPNQDPHILKCDMMGNIAMGIVRDLEPELDFGVRTSGHPKVDHDCAGEKDKEDLQVPPDFSLLGPLPPPPPLPCPVQGSPPPLSSGLSDIQNFTATYQQLETRRGEHTAAMLLRKKLQEGEMGMGMDNYAGRDFLDTKTSHHNQSLGHCLLTNLPHIQMPHHHQLSSPRNIMTGSQFIEPKLENLVPKGYFPSGKKRGRPVGSVNKQKRIQSQPQSSPVTILPSSLTSTPVPAATAPVEAQSCNTINVIPADSPQTEKVPATSVSPSSTPQTGNEVVEAEETKVEFNAKPRKQRRAKREESHGGLGQRQRRQEVDSILDKEDINAGIGEISSVGIFHGYNKSAFAPYIHVESKLEMGNVCTIVNWEDEKKKLESTADDGGGRCTAKEGGLCGAAPPNSTLSLLVKRDGEKSKVMEKKTLENVETALIQSSPTGKALPSSGYVLSGPAMSESSTRGHLLCCLCKKWANYKDLGDLYGPYYPPDYLTKLSKNPPVTRQSQGTVRLSSQEINLGSITAESTKQENPEVAIQSHTSQISSSSAADQATDLHLTTTVTDTTSVIDELDVKCDMDDNGNNDNLPNNQDLVSEKNTMAVELKPLEELNNLDQQLSSEQSQTEDAQKRPQHRKLTSHPRFKRRHKSNEDLRKTGPTNNKALLPFQPPPPLQLLKQGASDLSAAMAMLPQVPLDPEELWVHEGCIAWASGVFLVNGRLYGLQEALDGARDMCCSYCKMVGSTLGCYSKGCTLRYHYLCAIEADCSLNEDNFSLRCPKHKFPQNSKPAKVVDPDQSGRG